ncbi:MAG: Uma2 family endonuclease [Phycisphaerae bacterium]|nr:Uma2 family endonuclease [Phycisphaerae bacterium]
MIIERTHVSADEFLEIQTPDTVRLELDEGNLVVSPHNIFPHQYTARRLENILAEWAENHRAGIVVHEMDIRLGDRTVRAPDIVFIATEQKHILKRRRIIGAPKLVIEVLSESTEATDRGVKTRQYAAAGVAHYWLVDPIAQTFELFENRAGVFTPTGRFAANAEISPPAFPGLRFSAAALWLTELPPDE